MNKHQTPIFRRNIPKVVKVKKGIYFTEDNLKLAKSLIESESMTIDAAAELMSGAETDDYRLLSGDYSTFRDKIINHVEQGDIII